MVSLPLGLIALEAGHTLPPDPKYRNAMPVISRLNPRHLPVDWHLIH
jgi:hypothetical protein